MYILISNAAPSRECLTREELIGRIRAEGESYWNDRKVNLFEQDVSPDIQQLRSRQLVDRTLKRELRSLELWCWVQEGLANQRKLSALLSSPILGLTFFAIAPAWSAIADEATLNSWQVARCVLAVLTCAFALIVPSFVRRYVRACFKLGLALAAFTLVLSLYDTCGRQQLSVEWPASVKHYEAFIGGKATRLYAGKHDIVVYICNQSRVAWTCWLQEHADGPSIDGGRWSQFVRLGDEQPDLNASSSPISFAAVVAAGLAVMAKVKKDLVLCPRSSGPSKRTNDACESVRSIAGEVVSPDSLLDRLGALPDVVVAPVFEMKRVVDPVPSVFFEKATFGPHDELLPLAPRQRVYALCEPLKVEWNRAAYLETWYDSNPGPTRHDMTREWTIEKWPIGVDKIEMKISETKGRGPYDVVDFRYAKCQ